MTNSGKRESLNDLDKEGLLGASITMCTNNSFSEWWSLELTWSQSLNYRPHFITGILISVPFSRHSLHVWQKMSHAQAVGLLIPFLFSVVCIFAATFVERSCFKKPLTKVLTGSYFSFNWEREHEMRHWLSSKKKAEWDHILLQLMVPGAVPGSLSEAEPYRNVLVSTKEPEEQKKRCKINREKQHSWKFLEEWNVILFSVILGARRSALNRCQWIFQVIKTNWCVYITVES